MGTFSMRMGNPLLLLFLAAPSFQKELLQLGQEVTGSDINPCKGEDVLSCVMVDVDLTAFDDDILVLPHGVEVTKKNDIQEPASRSGLNDLAKSVAYSGQGCEAVFSFRAGKVIGNVEYEDGSDFVLEPCRKFPGCHVWKEEDTAHMEEDEGEEVTQEMRADDLISAGAKNELIQAGINDATTIVEYSIKNYSTVEFAAATDDIELYFNQVVAETNQGYINSNIPVRVKIFCIEATELNDEEEPLFTKFANYKGTAEALRGSADAAALLFLKKSACGRGYVDSWDNGRTITIQAKGCALGYYTMGHELAHNFGSTHDREHSSGNSHYSFGHGSYIEPRYRTIMGYNKEGYNTRVNYYSSPTAFYKRKATGSDTEDTARVIKENRFGFAAVGDESASCSSHTTSAPVSTTEAPVPSTSPITSTVETVTSTIPFTSTMAVNSTILTNSSILFTSTVESVDSTIEPVTSLGKCRDVNKLYTGGKQISKIKVKKAKVCEEKCFENDECTHWTFYKRGYPTRNLRKRCVLMTGSVTEVQKTKKVVSGAIDQCSQ